MIDEIEVFIKVAELGSFSAAAESLNLPQSTVSRRIQRLEDQLEVRLLNRTTRLVKMTTAGQEYYDRCVQIIKDLLVAIQENIYAKAKKYQQERITEVNSYEEFKETLDSKGGFVLAHWDGTAETEEKIKEETKATIRCIPLDQIHESGKCIFSGKDSKGRVLFAKAY